MKRKLLAAAAPCAALLVAGCAPSTSMTALIHMIDAQEGYFRAEVVEPFNRQRRVDVDVAHYAAMDSLGETLRQRRGEAGLVKTPFDKAWSLVDQGLIMPLNDILTPEEMREFDDIYLLTSLAAKDGKIYYTPRKFETRIMVYRKSKVAEAIAVWRKRRDAVSESLEPFNGYGLPATYVLEEDPGEWDYFDIYTLGWIWAHTPVDGETAPRVAHRGKRYSGTALRIIDRVYQCGGDSAAVLSMRSPAVADAFHWEAAYAAGGVYTPRMWEEAWSGSGVWDGFAQGAVYLSFMTQLDCFFIHGTGRDGLDGYLDDPNDMGVAPMPAGCSLELDAHGEPLRIGSHAITTGGWWWGIPAGSPDPRASYELARHITSAENQIAGCSRFGMIPVRKDILGDMSMLFGGGWISEVYAVSFKQLMHNKYTVLPSHPRFDAVRNAYLDAWFDIVTEKNWADNGESPSREYIARLLDERYGAEIQRLIAKGR